MALAIVVAAQLAAPMPANAQGWIEPTVGSIRNSVERTRTNVQVTIRGRVAEFEVEEWFHNSGTARFGEGDYLYPLPGEAVFSQFSLFQGDTELTGETMDAAQARSIYEAIVRAKRDPALIELIGHGLIRARVFPIAAGETRRITLRFTQVMDRAGDALQLRYSAGAAAAQATVSSSRSAGVRDADAPLTFTVVAPDGSEFSDPVSPTHRIRVQRRDGRMQVSPDEKLRGEFSLFLPLAQAGIGMSLAAHRTSASEDGYFMLTLFPGEAEGEALPRDITAVVDISGSMSGSKLTQARAALHQFLDSLGDEDRFRLIAFNNRVWSQSADWSATNPERLADARDWIRDLRAGGGTNIAGALDEAFILPSPEDRLPIVVFVTDGLPSVGETDPERIAASAGSTRRSARVFSFGVGYDVNTYLLDRLAVHGRGTAEYVEPGEDVELAVGNLVRKIAHPVLSDLVIDDTPVRVTDIYPVELPDLFAGDELVVFGRYASSRETITGPVAIRGERRGGTERFAVEAEFPRHRGSNEFIPRLWAARKLGYLTTTLRLEGSTPELLAEIRETAMRYGLLSEYTSYLVQEPQMVADEALRRDQPASAARPVEGAVGRSAVAAAKSAGQNRQMRSEADLRDAGHGTGDLDNAILRQSGGRVFNLRDGVWVDGFHRPSQEIVAVAAYSPAYFALLEAAPELAMWLSEFDRVLVAGAKISIQIDREGAENISGKELAILLRDFRG
jgi:Ca-activated chloride channel family protein